MESTSSTRRDQQKPARKIPLFLRRRPRQPKTRPNESAAVAREVYCYLQWARRVTTMTFDEIIVSFMDRALADYLRRDSVWRSQRAEMLSKQEATDWTEILSASSAGDGIGRLGGSES